MTSTGSDMHVVHIHATKSPNIIFLKKYLKKKNLSKVMFCLFHPSCLSILPPFLPFLFNVHWSFVCMKGVRYTGPEAADSCGSCRVDAGNWSQVSVRAASECFWATSSASLRLFWKGTSTFKNSLDLSEKEWFLLATHKTPRRMTKKWNLQHKLATTCSKGLCFQSSTL